MISGIVNIKKHSKVNLIGLVVISSVVRLVKLG
jgi:hypothetical protein